MTINGPSQQWSMVITGETSDIVTFIPLLEDMVMTECPHLLEAATWFTDNITQEELDYLLFSHPSDNNLTDISLWDELIERIIDLCDSNDLDCAYARIGINMDDYDFRPGSELVIPYEFNLCAPIRVERLEEEYINVEENDTDLDASESSPTS